MNPNNREREKREFKVDVTVTLSKTITIYTDKYESEGDGEYFQFCLDELDENDIAETVYLPHLAYKDLKKLQKSGRSISNQMIEDLTGWDVEEIDIVG